MSRATALSMAGKYRFTVTATDPLDSKQTFQSNEMQIAFSVPTAAPATPTPVPEPTAEPTFAPATIPPITDSSIGAIPKLIQKILLPLLILCGVLFVGSCGLLIAAKVRRAQQKKASEAAVDQLERAKRRDYVTPSAEEEYEEEVPEEEYVTENETFAIESDALAEEQTEFELPHLKYARSAAQVVETPAEEEPVYAEEAVESEAYYDQPEEVDQEETSYDDYSEITETKKQPFFVPGNDDYDWEQSYDQAEAKPGKRGLFGRGKKQKKIPAAETVMEEAPEYDFYDYEEEEQPQQEEEAPKRRSRRNRNA